MIVSYSYVTWDPPHLTADEELSLGREIAIKGREQFVAEFRANIGKQPSDQQGQPASPLRVFVTIIFLVGCLAVIVSAGMFLPVAVIIVFVTGIYLVSVHIATRKFEKWVDRLIARYAAHIALGGK